MFFFQVEVGCPQNESVKNGCQGATMGHWHVVIYAYEVGVAVAVGKFFNLAWKKFAA